MPKIIATEETLTIDDLVISLIPDNFELWVRCESPDSLIFSYAKFVGSIKINSSVKKEPTTERGTDEYYAQCRQFQQEREQFLARIVAQVNSLGRENLVARIASTVYSPNRREHEVIDGVNITFTDDYEVNVCYKRGYFSYQISGKKE